MRVEKFTRRSRRLVALLLAVLFCMPTSMVRGQTLLHTVQNPNSGQEGTGFGQAMASLGDVDGDGAPDFVVGAPNQSVGSNFAQGQAFVISGGQVRHTLNNPSPQAFAFFGWSVAGTGDVNGDGTPDVAVAALFQSVVVPRLNAAVNAGRVFVFSGSDGSLLYAVDNPAVDNPAVTRDVLENASFGYTIVSVGDLNGDGVRELAVGAPTHDVAGHFGQGRVYVFSGATGAPLRVLDNPDAQNFAFFGGAVGHTSDVNQDGVDDVAVGAPEQSSGQGRVFVFSGANGVFLGAVDNPTPQSGANFGDALVMVGDVNSNGTADLAVGAPGQDAADTVGVITRAGRVFVFDGVLGSSVVAMDAPNARDSAGTPGSTSFGRSLAAVGDYDGDGLPDLAVGARDHDISDASCGHVNCGAGAGQAYLAYGLTNAGGPSIVTLPDQGEPVAQTNANSLFGYQVVMVENAGSVGERYLAISAPGQIVNGAAAGQLFVYLMPAVEVPPAPDTTPPTLNGVPGDVVADATTANGAVVNYPSPTATDDQDPAPTVACVPASGSTFSVGTTPVTCTATDRSGNAASAGFTVIVRPNTVTPPDTSIPLDASVTDGRGRRLSSGDSTLSSTIRITFVGTGDVTGYHCSWDGKPYSGCTSPTSRSHLHVGKHVFRVRAYGAGGVDPSPATFEWTILSKGQAAKELKRSAKELELSRREQAKLQKLLREIKQHLTDRRRSNDKHVCDELGDVVKLIARHERTGVLTSEEGAPLRQLAESLQLNIGCRSKSWHAGHRHR